MHPAGPATSTAFSYVSTSAFHCFWALSSSDAFFYRSYLDFSSSFGLKCGMRNTSRYRSASRKIRNESNRMLGVEFGVALHILPKRTRWKQRELLQIRPQRRCSSKMKPLGLPSTSLEKRAAVSNTERSERVSLVQRKKCSTPIMEKTDGPFAPKTLCEKQKPKPKTKLVRC